MKAVVIRQFGAAHTHHVEHFPDPACGPHDVLLDVRAAGVNYPDALVIEGKYQFLPPFPFVPGKDAAGVVLEVGSQVTHLKPGDRAAAHLENGAYASRVAVVKTRCFALPDGISFIDAAAMGLTYQTAYFALLERGRFQAGETVLVLGAAGGVGSAAVQLVKALGGIALAGVRKPEQAAVARDCGADHIIDLAADNLRDSLRAQVHAVTQGKGADIVIDNLGGDPFDAALRALAWRGRLVVVGFAAGRIPTLKANYLLLKNIEVAGLQWSDYPQRQPDLIRKAQEAINALYLEKKIHPVVTAVLPLAQFATPLNLFAHGGAKGKYVLQIAD